MNIHTILTSKPHNEHYLKRYISFIDGCKTSIITEVYTEKHHICPKADDLFPEYGSFTKCKWNLIQLTARQHYIAHRILWKTFGGSQTYAYFAMINQQHRLSGRDNVKINSRTYASVKEDFSKTASKRLSGKSYTELYGEEKSKTITVKLSSALSKRNQTKIGKSYIDLYGEEKATDIKKKQSDVRIGKTFVYLYGEDEASIKKTAISARAKKQLTGKSKVEIYGSHDAAENVKTKQRKSIALDRKNRCEFVYVLDSRNSERHLTTKDDYKLNTTHLTDIGTAHVLAKNLLTDELIILPKEYFDSSDCPPHFTGQTGSFKISLISNRKEYSVGTFIRDLIGKTTYTHTLITS